MKAQCYLTSAPSNIVKHMRTKGFKGSVLTYENKSKKYPYSSVR